MALPQDTAATPQSIDPGSVISSAFTIYKDHAGILIGAALIVFAVEAVLTLVLGWVGAILSIVASTFFQGMVVELVRDVQDGRRDSSFGQLFSSVAPVVLPLLAVSILAGIGLAIGFVLLIIPGLFLMTIWSVVAPVVVVERPGVFAAFGRSRELVKGYGWQVFGVIVVVILIALVVGLLVAIITSGMSDAGRAAVQWALNVLTAPLSALLVSVLYFGLLRVRGERAGGSAVAAAAPAPATWAPPSSAPESPAPPATSETGETSATSETGGTGETSATDEPPRESEPPPSSGPPPASS
jgi:MFS family permease